MRRRGARVPYHHRAPLPRVHPPPARPPHQDLQGPPIAGPGGGNGGRGPGQGVVVAAGLAHDLATHGWDGGAVDDMRDAPPAGPARPSGPRIGAAEVTV